MGQQFSTGNEVVAGLRVGTTLKVVDHGVLEITSTPFPQPGDRIQTKYGIATVVRKSDRIHIQGGLNDGEVLYVADSDPVVRRMFV